MMRPSSSVLMVEQAPQNGCHQSFPKGSPSCLMPLPEALQDQQLGVPQAPFKACEIFVCTF